MYSLLIADDEDLVRNAISTIIDWESLGFTEIYQAEDGEEALEICRSHKIDLVLTDIVMPFMDGLELSTILNQEFPNIHVVILTGHENFEYAKRSVDLGVKNYILKPVGASTLYAKMRAICKTLDMEADQKEYIAKMRSQIRESMPILKEKFLYTLVCTEHGDKKNLQERIESMDISLGDQGNIVGIVEIDLSQTSNSDIELFIFTAKNIAQDSIGGGHCVFDDNNNCIIIVFNLTDFEEEGQFIAYNSLQVIQKAISAVLKIPVTCAMGSRVDTIGELYNSYREARTALDCKYSLGVDRVYDINDLDYIEKAFYYPFDGIKDLIYSIKFSEQAEIEQAMNAIVQMVFGSRRLSISNIKMVFIETITSLLKELSNIKKISPGLWNDGFALYNQLEQMNSSDQVVSEILQFAYRVSDELHSNHTNSCRQMVDHVETYIKEHYQDETLCLSSAAEHAAVSTGYLSAIFKKETGRGFVEYLTDVRMEKAMELLKTTDRKSYEIAYDVGFSNPHYFSTAFRKYIGLSPSEFRGN